MCGTLAKDSGTVIVAGENVENDSELVKRKIGVVFQHSVLDKALSVYDNLECRASLYGIYGEEFKNRLNELESLLGFKDILKRTVGKLSGGQRRKIDVARALIHNPEVLVLDEPTTGLDPQTRKTLWSVIDKLRKEEGMTVFLTTHYMEETTDADYVVIIDGGKIVAQGTPLELKNTYTGDFIYLYNVDEDSVKKLGVSYEKTGTAYQLAVENTAKATELIIKYPEIFKDYEVSKGKMDSVFLNVTGKKLEGGDK
jgi:multidrug/hemolysin transport system ATP-binding protein